MASEKKPKKRKQLGTTGESLEITRRSVNISGKRTTALAFVAAVALGLTYLVLRDGSTVISASGNNAMAIGQAGNVTVNNGDKGAK